MDKNRIKSLRTATFPSSLIELYFYGNNIESIADISGIKLPSSLKKLYVSGRHNYDASASASASAFDDIEFPSGLQVLHLVHMRLTTLYGLPLPMRLKELNVSDNQIKSLRGITFPTSVSNLIFDNNKIDTLNGVELPPHLIELSMNNNKIGSLDGVLFLSASMQKLSLQNNPISKPTLQSQRRSRRQKKQTKKINTLDNILLQYNNITI